MADLINEDTQAFLGRLADDIIYDTVSEQFISLDFLSEPVPLSKAPENTLLLVLADALEFCNPIPATSKKAPLLKGSVIVKISEGVRNTFLRPACKQSSITEGLLYSALSFFKVRIKEDEFEIHTKENHLTKYNKRNTTGFVIPISDVLVSGTPLFADVEPEYLKEDMDMSKLLTPFASQIIVVISDVQGREFRRSWLDASTHTEAIRRTLDATDSYSQISDIVRVEVVGCL